MQTTDIKNGDRLIIQDNGTVVTLAGKSSLRHLLQQIGADTCDTVTLRHLGSPRMVMIVDDTGMIDNKPINALATALYHRNAPNSPYSIHGTVAVVPDRDFA